MPSLFRLAVAVTVGALAVACGARTNVGSGASTQDAGASFPVGTYTSCAFGTAVASGPFLIPAGFDGAATLTVTESGDARTATYVDGNGRPYTWTFTTTTSASAALAPTAQSTGGFGSSICVYGVGNEKFFPTKLDAASGAMTYESGTVFISLQGELTSHADCGEISAPASVWIACTDGPAPPVSAPASASPFPVGDYACVSQVGTHATLNGQNWFILSGGSGTLTLTQSGAQVTAQYAGDTEVAGALDLTLNAASTGSAAADQTLTARCQLDPFTKGAQGELTIAAASLTADEGTVFLSFSGTMSASSACPGAEKIATLVCAKK